MAEQPRRPLVDLRSLEYISHVDENLVCPVCRVALIDPVTTSCEHVFCRDCFDHSYTISPTCPIDRLPLIIPHDLEKTHRLILNQLDGLDVKCPHSGDGCPKILARSMVQNHVDKYCGYSLVPCSEKTCDGKVTRKDLHRGCLHWDAICPDCEEGLLEVDMEKHREKECEHRRTTCEKCLAEILRCHVEDHHEECPEADAPCRWTMYGCEYHSKRKDLGDHATDCEFRIMGPVVEALKSEITTLRGEVQTLSDKDKAKDRRIKFLESDRSITSSSSSPLGYPVPDMSTLPDPSPASMEYAPYDSRDQYLLSLLESQESRVDQISAGLTEIEAKQTMMLFNETIPIKNELAELRSTLGLLNMHVRWLMNFRIQERRPGPGAGPSNQPKPNSSTGGSDLASPRRSSDTVRDLITKL